MLADEPISMLDVSIRMGILNLMERLKAERGIAYLYITHDIASARYIADETIVMYAGRMVEGAAGDDLIRHPAHPYTQLLLSAVPDPRAPRQRRTRPRGEVPSLIDPPPGCPFAGRCPHTMDVCRQVMPGVDDGCSAALGALPPLRPRCRRRRGQRLKGGGGVLRRALCTRSAQLHGAVIA